MIAIVICVTNDCGTGEQSDQDSIMIAIPQQKINKNPGEYEC